jgi:hypothetical protein
VWSGPEAGLHVVRLDSAFHAMDWRLFALQDNTRENGALLDYVTALPEGTTVMVSGLICLLVCY